MRASEQYTAKFVSVDGAQIQGQEAVIPICSIDHSDGIKCIGTGFLIGVHGIFVTAAHVVQHVLSPNGQQIVDAAGDPKTGLWTCHFTPPGRFIRREVIKGTYHMRDDVAVGALSPLVHADSMQPLKNKILTMTNRVPETGEIISTWAYPKCAASFDGTTGQLSIVPQLYVGQIECELREGRGGLLPGRCYQTTLGIEGGASGGPVFDQFGRVFAVNSTAIAGTNLAYVSHVQAIGGLPLANVRAADGVVHENITIAKLIEGGVIPLHRAETADDPSSAN